MNHRRLRHCERAAANFWNSTPRALTSTVSRAMLGAFAPHRVAVLTRHSRRGRPMATPEKTVTLSIASPNETTARALAAFRGEAQGARISFASVELLWKMLTPRRWAILRAMAGQGGLSIREIARRVGRDVKAVHGDVHALIKAGLLDRDAAGLVAFPFDAVRVEFTLAAA
jgi:predicted transcriptional regulator